MLRIEDLHKAFGDVIALDGCIITVQRGQMLGLLGPNGAGKTTAMRAIFGLVRPEEGTLTWDGQPISRAVRRRFGYIRLHGMGCSGGQKRLHRVCVWIHRSLTGRRPRIRHVGVGRLVHTESGRQVEIQTTEPA